MNAEPRPPEWLLGNDVVDLYDPDSRGVLDNHAFLDRVFVPAEREILARLREPDMAARMAWSLWAGKEAAYKALRAARAELVWSPRAFVVHIEKDSDWSEGRLAGLVGHKGGDTLAFDCDYLSGAYVHARCLARREAGVERLRYERPGPDRPRLLSAVAERKNDADESAAVRALALRLAAEAYPGLELEIAGDIPRLRAARGILAAPLSLSHHGGFVAAALLALESHEMQGA